MRFILGLTGSIQHGKRENRPLFEQAGWHFINVNDLIYELRKPGSEWFDQYERAIPGGLDEQGRLTAKYYMQVKQDLHIELLHPQFDLITETILDAIAKAEAEERIVVSWENLGYIAKSLPLNHTWFLTSEEQVWFVRIRKKALTLDLPELDDSMIRQIIKTINFVPRQMLVQTIESVGNDYSIIDVSGDSFGADSVLAALSQLP